MILRRLVLVCLICSLAFITAAHGQVAPDGVEIGADNIDPLDSKPPIVEYVFAGVFLVGVLAVGIKPSKRGVHK